jgi:hypothetical protein
VSTDAPFAVAALVLTVAALVALAGGRSGDG